MVRGVLSRGVFSFRSISDAGLVSIEYIYCLCNVFVIYCGDKEESYIKDVFIVVMVVFKFFLLFFVNFF